MIHSVCSLAPHVPLLTTGECENNSSCGGQRGQQKNSLWLSQRSNSVWPIEGFDSYMREEGAQLCPVNQLKPAQQKGGKCFVETVRLVIFEEIFFSQKNATKSRCKENLGKSSSISTRSKLPVACPSGQSASH